MAICPSFFGKPWICPRRSESSLSTQIVPLCSSTSLRIDRRLSSGSTEKMCGGSLQPLLTNLIRVKRLTPHELRELLALVDSLDAKTRSRKERGS